jgi:uncharacterized protein (TIGR02246 family)
MKIRLLFTLAGLLIGFALPIYSQQTVDPKVDQQIRVLASKYDAALNRHDAAAVAALYTQDAVRGTYEHGTFRGREAIENMYEKWFFKTWQVRNYSTTVGSVSAVGNELRSTGTWS